MSIHASNGSLLGEALAPGTLGELANLQFVDEDHVLASGSRDSTTDEGTTADAIVQLVDLEVPEATWTREYNRALGNCYYDVPSPGEQPTWESFHAMVRLPDGSLLIATIEEGVRIESTQATQPRVIHIDANGEFLAGDRGLWTGRATALAADADGSAYAILTIGGGLVSDAPSEGFRVRKYQP
ncbi:hypothetical protein ACNOYE_29980 [Nannocystaceae bacterium ST9]